MLSLKTLKLQPRELINVTFLGTNLRRTAGWTSLFLHVYVPVPVSTEFRSLLGFSSQLLTFFSLPHSIVVVPSAQSEEQKADSYYRLWYDKYEGLNTDAPPSFVQSTHRLHLGPTHVIMAFSDSSRTTSSPPPNPSLVREYSKLLAGLRMRWHASMKTRRSDGCSPKPRLMRTYKMSLHTKMGSFESDGHCKHPEDVESWN
jgi:hypothetical protein